MTFRIFTCLSTALLCAAFLPAQTPNATAKGASPAKTKAIPRAADGHPDLQGIWTNATVTPMERPPQFAGKLNITDAEAAAYEKDQAQDLQSEDGQSDGKIIRAAGSSGTGGYNVLFVDRGTEMIRVDGVKRSSLIIDPPDGRVPPITDEARKRNASAMRNFNKYDDVKERPLSERCIIGFGSTAGPPMMPVLYNNTYQIVQTKDKIMILVEMVHDVRVIRMNGTHVPSNVRLLLGDSIGHWEGDTLVVDTTNFTNQTSFRGSSENLHVIERFQRIGPDQILYRATIDDPSTYTKQWTMEFPFRATAGPIYEYACHEGNYAMTDIMGGARKMESEQKQK
ncbi:MAG TPA: hypothetical protein VKX49_31715 [Bryobacteraceae bacterium]|nr:hypothetical protein [Bryobacteraceae bacterium]